MKKIKLMSLLSLALLAGCANGYGLIKENRASVRSDVFQEVADPAAVPGSYADLRINGVLKTHSAERSASVDSHGTSDYRLLLNIDGQALTLAGGMRQENKESERLYDPEAGEGTRYRFTKVLRLKPGVHRLVVGLPDDQVAVAKDLHLKAEVNTLELEPVYGQKIGAGRPRNDRARSFTEGIRSFRVILNGKEV
ncbi:lipoprotein [Geomonas silvestris]|uniref:Lipoprotein n=1 Tax=Geomonas silvestris TaxID=2740184 RepID=A0A6V8MEL6_9BACT|nr:hypothetical protein [Geomonas silvestris]GFO58420.1 lipoprotein [Geomonas silvestris]